MGHVAWNMGQGAWRKEKGERSMEKEEGYESAGN